MLGKRDRLSIQDMLNAASRAVRYASEVSEREFEIDEMRLDAAMNALAIIGEASKRVSPDGRRQLPEIDWRRLADLRQFVVHKYFQVEPAELRRTLLEELPVLIARLRDAGV